MEVEVRLHLVRGLCERFRTELANSVCGACSHLLYWQSQNQWTLPYRVYEQRKL